MDAWSEVVRLGSEAAKPTVPFTVSNGGQAGREKEWDSLIELKRHEEGCDSHLYSVCVLELKHWTEE